MVTSFCHLFGLFLAIFGHFNVILCIFHHFLQFFAILCQVIWCWYYWPHLDHFPKHFGSFCAIFGQYLVIFGHFRPFWAIFGHFWLFWVIFGHFGHFWPFLGHFRIIFVCNFLPFWGQLIQCWYSLPNLDHLPKQFRPFQGHIWLFWAILCHFWPIWVMYQSFV